jgi:antitoxin (DNA-binding transcriptional repressor) of toxin-antitoxin stability system
MTTDMVDQLSSVGFTVLAPSYIPGPFGSLPSVSASSGYYSMYWVIPGAPPTYLLVIGGDSIPDYSKYDRNVPLTQNDSVMGYPAWHDQTPDYDLVYFIMDGVVYSVESNNLSGDTTMGIANSLASVDTYTPEPTPTEEPVDEPTETPTDTPSTDDGETDSTDTPDETATEEPSDLNPSIDAPENVQSGDEATITVDGIASATLSASSGTFELTGRDNVDGAEPSTFQWTAPETENGRTVRFKLTDPDSGELLATTTTQVEPIPDDQIPVVADDLSCPDSVEMGSLGGISIKGSGQLLFDASDGTFPDIGPNSTFAGPSEIDDSDVLQGVNRRNKTTWVFWQPADASEGYTAYIFLQDWSGTTQLECGINVVPASDLPTYPDGMPSDGTAGSGGIGYAPLANEPDGSAVNSNEYPAVGQLPDGSTLALESIPVSDGTLIADSPSPEASPTASQ